MTKAKLVPPEVGAGVPRVPRIDLSPLAADAPDPPGTVAVQASLMDPESKKVFEALIVEIRRQLAGGNGQGTPGGVPATVVADLNSLRDAICLTNASLDADAGVATTTFATGNPPPITTA
jgi:hypothetical protein